MITKTEVFQGAVMEMDGEEEHDESVDNSDADDGVVVYEEPEYEVPEKRLPPKKRLEEQKAVDFRVALALSKYGFGAMYTAKQLLRSRGMVQSWKKMGERHYLAKRKYSRNRVVKRLWKIRRVTTFKDLDYHLAKKLFDFNLSSSYIAKKLGIPISTVNSWRKGNSPSSVRDDFIDRELVDSKFDSLLASIKRGLTEENIDYFLALKISNEAKRLRSAEGTRNIGARTISGILHKFLHSEEPLPERTVSSWIKGERRPHNIEARLVDNGLVTERFKELVLELSKEHIDFHIAKELEKRDWRYSAIALFLHLDKEKVRGWIKKDRGSPVAKTFMDRAYVDRVLRTMLASAQDIEDAVACTIPKSPSQKRRRK
jgi:predicted transcriptional regulator